MIREKIVCGLDLGSQKIKAGLIKAKDLNSFEVLGLYENNTLGFKETAVSDLGELSECVHSTINSLAEKTGVKVKSVFLGIGGELIDLRQTSTMIPLLERGSKIISTQDIKNVNQQAKLLGLKVDEEILHVLPQHYQVDDVSLVMNPLGLYGRKLGVKSLMLLANVNRIKNISKAVHQAGYDVEGLFFSTFAASDVVLNNHDRDEGCGLIDIGSKGTSILIFKENILKYVYQISIGGDDFTRSIANRLNLPFDLAEEIKKSYAGALSSDQYREEEVLVKRETGYMPIKKEVIYEAINSEIGHLVKNIFKALKDSGYFEQINCGITMIGGGAHLPGLVERVAQETNITTHLGRIKDPDDYRLQKAILFSPVIGLARMGLKNSFKISQSDNVSVNWTTSFINKVKDIYQEYF